MTGQVRALEFSEGLPGRALPLWRTRTEVHAGRGADRTKERPAASREQVTWNALVRGQWEDEDVHETGSAANHCRALTTAFVGLAQAEALRDKWCKDVHIRFFVGGAEGDAFGTIVYNGAKQAANDTRRAGRLRLLRLEGGEDGPAAPRGSCGQARRHRHDGPSGRRRDHAARRGGVEGRHQDDVPERAAAGVRREVRRRLCRRPAGAAGPRARRGSGPSVRAEEGRQGDRARTVRPAGGALRARGFGTPTRSKTPASRSTKLVAPAEWAADPNLAHPDHHRGAPANPDIKLIALSRRPACSATCRPTWKRPARSRATSSTSASTPARRSSKASRTAGCSSPPTSSPSCRATCRS